MYLQKFTIVSVEKKEPMTVLQALFCFLYMMHAVMKVASFRQDKASGREI